MKKTTLHNYSIFNRTPIAILINCQLAFLMGYSDIVQARDFFDPAFLEIGSPSQRGSDLSVFEDGNMQAPGLYRVDVYLNKEMVDTQDIQFQLKKGSDGKESLQPCLNRDALKLFGVRVDAFPAITSETAEACIDLAQAIPMASATFRFNQQRLDLSIPQIAINKQARDYISPEKWDNGIPALIANYNFSGANESARSSNSRDSDTYYLNLRSGVNLGAWRLRNYSTWNRDAEGQQHWDSINTFLKRDIISLKSQLTLGDSATSSDVFDSVPFRGGQLASDDDMLPDSLKGYSPVVQGIAKSNAQVTIRQNGYVIYQSYVAPGAFEIKDLYPTAGSGDLNVTIKETDGSERNFVVPFASVPVLQREGRFKYAITSGQYRSSNSDVDRIPFTQAIGIYGLPWGATLYGGFQSASKYQSIAMGLGQNMGPIGALSADVTQAWAKPQDAGKESGQSWRLRYGKSFVETGTNFSLASYRYSTRGFYTLQEAMETYTHDPNYFQSHKKNRAELTLSQTLWENAGSLSLSIISEEYWNDNQRNQSANIGYNNSWEGISFGVNYTYSKNGYDSSGNHINNTDHIVAVNVNIPLSRWLPDSYASYNVSSSRRGNTSHNVGLNGTMLENNNLSYNITQGYTSQGQGANGTASLDYRGGQGEVNIGYGYDRDQQRISYGLQGGLLIHENGLTLSQPLGDTVALVKAPGAKNVRVLNQTGVETDWRGYAVVPYLSVYHRNIVSLDTTTLADNVDMALSSQAVIPTRGAVGRAEFKADVGQRVLFTLLMSDNHPVPFGATVTNMVNTTNSASFVGDGGEVYMSGLADTGKLNVKWGNQVSQSCQVNYSLDSKQENTGIAMISGQCL
ncbi:fimbria/pilus outer membrane usher protein [Buttiauxella noackiae]|uniref:fimbria/pilus outer membrane usher protein n=1 Tax=Buttiauxella noackiae TaxID=82992 RepID=UPI0036F2C50D